MYTPRPPRATAASLALVVVCLTPRAALAQSFEGRVVDDQDEQPVPTALVRLLDEDGESLALSIADSTGFYRVRAPEPGSYRLEATRLGFENFQTPLLDASVADGTYRIDLLMRAAPLPLQGLTVETDRVSDEEADRQVRLMIGLSPASLRYRPIGFDEIQDHVASRRSLVDAMRAGNYAGLIVWQSPDGPCFSLRGRSCLPVYLNSLHLRRDFVEGVPLDMVHRIVLVTPTDGSVLYPNGAILLYTEAWLR